MKYVFIVGGRVPDAIKATFLREVTQFLEFNHKNVILLEGIVIRDKLPLVAFMWTQNGNLKEYLRLLRASVRLPTNYVLAS